MKILKKYWLKLLGLFLILILGIYVVVFAFKKARDYEIYKQPKIETKIYTIWNIETFEGGGKTRINYLKNITKTIENKHDGALFMISNIKPENLESGLSQDTPDIISFGYGVGKIILPKLKNFDKTYNVRDELVESGTFNKKVYALPYIVSGYALFNHSAQAKEFRCGTTGYTKPEKIYNNLNLYPIEMQTQYEAYKNFVNNKNCDLLGTARDVFRVYNLNKIGRTNASITPIDTYTDLLQYVAITNSDAIIDEFIEKIFDRTNQLSLAEYSLFSAIYDKIYYDGIYANMEEAILACEIAKCFE